MEKEEYIKKYGRKAYRVYRKAIRDWGKQHPARSQAYYRGLTQKEGKNRVYKETALSHLKNLIRSKHIRRWGHYKQIIAPESQIHHQWIPGTPDYRGVALVEKDQHMHGYIDVIQILEGEITLLTEAEIRGDKY